MTKIITLAASSRDSVGKGPARAVRRELFVPAVIYGDKKTPLSISLEEKILVRYVNKAGFFNHLFDVELDGKKHRVLPRDVQFHPVTDRPLHVDFLRISDNTKVKVHVPISFIDQALSEGMKHGGALNVVHHDIEVLCSPNKIPEVFEVSLKDYVLSDAISIKAIILPKGVELTAREDDFTIASIAIPSAVRSEADAAPGKASAEGEEDAEENTDAKKEAPEDKK